jgi:nitroreductase
VLTGASRQGLVDKVTAAFKDSGQLDHHQQHREEYDYYPEQWVSPYIDRRRKVGWDLYGLLGIAKGDRERMQAQQARNYAYFDAPVGLVFTIERVMGRGSWLDYGMFLQNIMIAARARGLDTCPQAAFNQFHSVIGAHIGLDPAKYMVVVSMALGYADPDALDNTLLTEREPVSGFTQFLD